MTKLKSLLLMALCCATFMSFGQSKIDIGVEGGASLIFLRGNEILQQNYGTNVGFSGGASFQYNFKKILSIHTGVSFERKGAAINDIVSLSASGNIVKQTAYDNYNYLTFPVLVRASFGKKTQFFVNAGPYFGYLLNHFFRISKKEKYDETEYNKKFDAGISTGLGVLIPFGKKTALTFELRNNLGLYNVSALPVYKNGAIKTNSLNMLAGLVYRIGA